MTLCRIGRCGRERSLESHRPVPRVLGPWRTRLGVARQQARGDQRVTPAREQGLGRERRRLTDAPPVRAPSAVPSTLGWVTPTRQRLVAAARPEVPARVAADRKDVDGLAHRVATCGRGWRQAPRPPPGPAGSGSTGPRPRRPCAAPRP